MYIKACRWTLIPCSLLSGCACQGVPANGRRRQGNPLAPDKRIYVWLPTGESVYHIGITHPGSCWAKAGLHSGYPIIAISGRQVKSRKDFYDIFSPLRIGDTAIVEISRPSGMQNIPVVITGYQLPQAHITKNSEAGNRTQKLYREWEQGITATK